MNKIIAQLMVLFFSVFCLISISFSQTKLSKNQIEDVFFFERGRICLRQYQCRNLVNHGKGLFDQCRKQKISTFV